MEKISARSWWSKSHLFSIINDIQNLWRSMAISLYSIVLNYTSNRFLCRIDTSNLLNKFHSVNKYDTVRFIKLCYNIQIKTCGYYSDKTIHIPKNRTQFSSDKSWLKILAIMFRFSFADREVRFFFLSLFESSRAYSLAVSRMLISLL